MRRPIRRREEKAIRARVGEACPAIARRLLFAYPGGGSSSTAGASDAVVRIEVNSDTSIRGLSAPELFAMARAGIYPGQHAWEIDDDSAAAAEIGGAS